MHRKIISIGEYIHTKKFLSKGWIFHCCQCWTVIYMLNTQKSDFNWRSYFNIHTKKRWIFHCCPSWTVIYMLNAQKNGPGSRQDKSSSNPSQKREIRRTVLVNEKRTKLNILLLSTRSQKWGAFQGEQLIEIFYDLIHNFEFIFGFFLIHKL